MTKDEAKTVCVQPAQDLRSFPEAADGRPMPPMGDELMTAGLNCEDARFVAIQLAQNGLTLVSMTQNTTTPDLIKRMERIVRSEYAYRDHLILDCDLGQITFGDVRDLCDAASAERDALKAENEHKDAEIERLHSIIARMMDAAQERADRLTSEEDLSEWATGANLVVDDLRPIADEADAHAEQKGDA